MLLISSGDAAQVQAVSGFSMTAPAIIAAVITAILTLAGILIKDYFLKRLDEGRSEKKDETAVYQRYSHPLVTSAVSLLHRFNEILFVEHRPIYLTYIHKVGPEQDFARSYLSYKKLSTIYRLAAMLGWIRACRREFSYLRLADQKGARTIDQAIGSFEKALADGNWVEQERANRLCELWQLSSTTSLRDVEEIEQLGTKVNNVYWGILKASNLEKEDSANLDPNLKIRLCRETADCITSHLKTNPVSEEALERTRSDAFRIITMREAWIFRDWQNAIGDVMTRSSQVKTRDFEVIGYGEFELFLARGSEAQKLAAERLLSVFDGLDFSIEDRFDCRPRQLRAITKSAAELVLAIHHTQGKRSIVPRSDLDLASKIASKVAR